MNGVTMSTEERVKRWIMAKKSLERDFTRYEESRVFLQLTENELGKWLCPPDAQVDERFNIWYGSGVLQASPTTSQGDATQYKVTWRKEPDAKQRMEEGM